MPPIAAVLLKFRWLAVVFLLVAPSATLLGQEKKPPVTEEPPAQSPSEQQNKPGSAAERIAGIGRLLESDRQRQAELEQSMLQLDREFEEASNEFAAADKQFTQGKTQEKVPAEASDAELPKTLRPLAEARAKARDRFDTIIKRRKAFQQQLDILKEKLAVADQALQRATSSESPAAEPPPESPIRLQPTETPSAAKQPLDLTIAGALAAPEPAVAANAEAADAEHVIDPKVVEARKELAMKQAVLQQAEQDLVYRDRALDVFQRDLESIRQLLAIAQEELLARKAAATTAAADLKRAQQAAAHQAELDALQEQERAAQTKLQATQQEVEKETARLADTEKLLNRMQEGRAEISQRIEASSAAVESAKLQLQFLESPIAPHRLIRWVLRAGPRILSILVAMVVFWWLSRVLAQRIVMTVVRHGMRGTATEREGRAETLRRVFQSTVSSAIFLLGALALLDQAGVNVTVLLGGAAVLGAAIAFGSQNLIKDYFSGFMILVENQYSVGNVVKIGDVSGVVEDITLRMTVLRDEEGVVHFLPHSQVTMVSNLTQGWSRAVIRVRVAYDEDVDRILAILHDIALELGREQAFQGDLIGEPEMQGVDSLDESAVIVKFLVKTRPLRQWAVKRDLLRRIQRKFRELGIETPYPQRIIHARPPADGNQS